MGTWSQPNTTEKATLLQQTMREPILKNKAYGLLYPLVGDDELFNKFDELENDEDVRWLVRHYLKGNLQNLHLSLEPWDAEALRICKQIVGNE